MAGASEVFKMDVGMGDKKQPKGAPNNVAKRRASALEKAWCPPVRKIELSLCPSARRRLWPRLRLNPSCAPCFNDTFDYTFAHSFTGRLARPRTPGAL